MDSSPTQKIYFERLITVFRNTVAINAMCEVGDHVGAATAGAFLNACVEHYLREMEQSINHDYEPHELFEIEANTLYSSEKMPPKIFKVPGVGFFNEYANPKIRQNPLLYTEHRGTGRMHYQRRFFNGGNGGGFAFISSLTLPIYIPGLRNLYFKLVPVKSIFVLLMIKRFIIYLVLAKATFVNAK